MTTRNIIKKSIAFFSLAFVMLGFFAFAGVDPVDPDPGTATLIGSTIQQVNTTTLSESTDCDSQGDPKAYYSGARIYMKVQSQAQSSRKRIVASSRILVYDPYDSFQTLAFPTISNIIPHKDNDIPVSNKKVVVVDAGASSKIQKPNASYQRGDLAGQLVWNGHYQGISTTSTSNMFTYTYRLLNETSARTVSLNSNMLIPVIDQTSVCWDYYVAYCGDGVIDNPEGGGNGDGVDGIKNSNGDIIEWSQVGLDSVTPAEVCDDGNLNGTPGHCKTDCTGLGVNTQGAQCTITTTPSSIEAGQSVTINASYTSGQNPIFSPTLSGFVPPFSSPTWSETTTDSPTATTTYTMTVDGANGLSGTSCSATVTVIPPEPHLSCYLTFTPSPIVSGQMVAVGRHITGGTFVDAWIYANPAIFVGGGRPYEIGVNDFNGTAMAQPNSTGDYTFSLQGVGMIYGGTEMENFACTGTLPVLPNIPPTCNLTTTTPTINIGETATISASYNYTSLATFTPMVTGLNFLYPNRINTGITVTPTETTTYTMNVLGYNGSGSTCSTTIHVRNTGLNIMKELITNVVYHSGDLVTFKVNFSNNSSGIIHNIILSDTLPLPLEYVSSSLNGVTPPYNFSTGMLGIYQRVVYSGFSLAPGQQGYMLIAGRVRGYEYAGYSTINRGFIEADGFTYHHGAGFMVYSPVSSTTIIKTSNKSSYYPGEDAGFTLAVTNNGPDTINNITITDDRPNSCITLDTNYTSNVSLTPITSIDPFQWQYAGSLVAGQTIYLYLTGHISNDLACIGTHINNANILYTINGQTQTGVADPLSFQVSTTPSSTMNFEKRLISYGSNPGDPVVFELLYQNNGTATITNYEIVDYRPGTLNFVSSSPMPTTQTPNAGGSLLRWIITTPLAPNGSGKITINGTLH